MRGFEAGSGEDFDIAGARFLGGHRREPGCTLHRPRHHRDQAAAIFMVIRRRSRKPRLGQDAELAVRRDADIDADQITHFRAGRFQKMGWLEGAKSDGGIKCPDFIEQCAMIGLDSARQVDRHAPFCASEQAAEISEPVVADRSGQSGSEQAVDKLRSRPGIGQGHRWAGRQRSARSSGQPPARPGASVHRLTYRFR